jgi:hypothetical protein
MIEMLMGEQQIVDAGRVKTKRPGVFFVQFARTFKQAAVDQDSAFATVAGQAKPRCPFTPNLSTRRLEKRLGIATYSYQAEPTSRHAEKIIFNARGEGIGY